MKTENNVVFAYFADGEWIGWYGDSFGSISTCPKIYGYSEKQVATVTGNFRYKLEQIAKTTAQEVLDNAKNSGQALSALINIGEDRLRGKEIELRIVQTPFFDGPNPLFLPAMATYLRKVHTEMYHEWCNEHDLEPGIEVGERAGIALIDNYKKFVKIYPYPSSNNWIYADYQKVKLWAQDEPTEFIKIITNN